MPVVSEEVTRISCDNPGCPGTDLDPSERLGWLFVTAEVYGEPTGQHVFCSAGCLSVVSGDEGPAQELGFAKKADAPGTA